MLFDQKDMQMIVNFLSHYGRKKTIDLEMQITPTEFVQFIEQSSEKIAYVLSDEFLKWKKAKEIECGLQEPEGIY